LRPILKGDPNGERKTRLPKRSMRSGKKKGYRAERELVAYLREKGWSAWRIPTSASSSESLPDVLAVKGDELAAFEVKYRRESELTARVDEEQVQKLLDFLKPFSLYRTRPVIALRARRKWTFRTVSLGGKPTVVRDGEESDWTPDGAIAS
ncbi:MAG: hypothetical protein RAK24_04255, partial [TACK group archaeon]|nr:hypothetical protein [TACK group archaeon]